MDIVSGDGFKSNKGFEEVVSEGNDDDLSSGSLSDSNKGTPSRATDSNHLGASKVKNIECIAIEDDGSISSDDLLFDFESTPLVKTEKTSESKLGREAKSTTKTIWQEIEPDSNEESSDSADLPVVNRKNCKAEDRKSAGCDDAVSSIDNPDKPTSSGVQPDAATTISSRDSDAEDTGRSPKATEKAEGKVEEPASDANSKKVKSGSDKKERKSDEEKEVESQDDVGEETNSDSDSDSDGCHGKDRATRIKEMKTKLAIGKLEYLVEKLNRKIKVLEERELSFDDMADESVYTQLELYKKKLVLAWKKLCELKSLPSSTERDIEKPFVFKGTSYTKINKAISKFVNKYKTFPDYQDVSEIVCTCNDFFKLKLNKQALSTISLTAFADVGKALKSRRIRDYKENTGCHITDQFANQKDPALEDAELRRKLEDNRRKAESNLEKTFHHFESMPAKNIEESSDSEESSSSSEGKDGDVDEGQTRSKVREKKDESAAGKMDKGSKEKNESKPKPLTADKNNKSSESSSSSSEEEDKEGGPISKPETREQRTEEPANKKMDKNLKKEKKSESSSEANAIESDNESDCASNDDSGCNVKKSLSVEYDAARRLSRPPASAAKRGGAGSIIVSSSSSSCSMTTSTRSLRSHGRKTSPPADRVGEGSKPSKRKSTLGPKCAKRAKIVEADDAPPTFIRLVDEMRGGKGVQSERALIVKALLPSRVMLTNCMLCRVVCSKDLPETPARVVATAPPALKESSDVRKPSSAKRKRSNSSKVGETKKKFPSSKSLDFGERKKFDDGKSEGVVKDDKGKKEGEKATAAGDEDPRLRPQQREGAPPTPHDEAKEVKRRSASRDEEEEEEEEGANDTYVGNVVGEVLEGYDDGYTSREDEGIVESVSSLVTVDQAASKKSPNVDCHPLPASGDRKGRGEMAEERQNVVVDLEDEAGDPKGEDGVIFVGTYSKASPPPPPQTMQGGQEPGSATGQGSSGASRHPPILSSRRRKPVFGQKLVLGQRTSSYRAFNFAQSVATNVANGPLIPLGDIGAYSGSGRLASKFLDPSLTAGPLDGINLPKLPAKVMKQINSMARKLTMNALRGRGRGLVGSEAQGRDRAVARRGGFVAGRALAANFSNAPRRARKGPGRAAVHSRVDFDSEGQSGSSFQCYPLTRPPLHGRVGPSHHQRNRGGRGNNNRQPPMASEAVIIDDDDDPQFARPDVPAGFQEGTVAAAESSRSPNADRTFSPNFDHTLELEIQLSQQRKLQRKTTSNDSDVILCGMDFDPDASRQMERRESARKERPNPIGESEERMDDRFASEAQSEARSLASRSLRIKTISNDSDVILCEDGMDFFDAAEESSPAPHPNPAQGAVDPHDRESTNRDRGPPRTPDSQPPHGPGVLPGSSPPSTNRDVQSDVVILLD